MERFEKRRQQLRKQMHKAKADALLVTNFVNVTYLTGFTGDDSYLLLTGDGAIVLSDPRYTTQLETECSDVEREIRRPGVTMTESVAQVVKRTRLQKLGVEASSMTLSTRKSLGEALPDIEVVETSDLVEELRAVKDKNEIDRVRRACWQARRAFDVVRASLTPEMTEKQVAADLEYQLRRFGAKGCSFPPIVAVGAQAALPHARPGEQKIGAADFVLIDWGSCEELYMSDLTRLVVTAKISPKLERIYGVVLQAQLAAIEAIRPGVTCEAVDQVARDIITEAGFGKQFGHGLGHGIGLEIHEGPRLAQKRSTVLQPGMVVTVEPGIYLPKWGGVRIEDDILVTRTGAEVLTSVPKELGDCVLN